MELGCISIERGRMNLSGESVINLGDYIRLLAVLNLYKKELEGQVKRIEYYDIFSYSGDEMLLPINFIWFNPLWGEQNLILPPTIHPIFLGIHSIGNAYSEKEISYLKKFQPIGCRDRYTYFLLKDLGINCYLQGCLTATLPKRIPTGKEDKVYCVDVSDELMQYMPYSLKKEAIITTHQYYGLRNPDEQFEDIAKKGLNYIEIQLNL